MKIMLPSLCLTLGLIVTVCAGEEQAANAWATDWSAFVKQLAVEVAKENYFVGNVNDAFLDRRVQWEGKITEIERPSSKKAGSIRIGMKPGKLEMKSGTATLDSILVRPKASEWAAWDSASVGETVQFATTLSTSSWAVPECVLSYMKGVGANAGKTVAWINTKGAQRLGMDSNPTKTVPKRPAKGPGQEPKTRPQTAKGLEAPAEETSPKHQPRRENRIVGQWTWFNGDVHEFFADGRAKTIAAARGTPGSGTWKEIRRGNYEIKWGSRWVDSLALSEDGTRLQGRNQEGARVWGKKRKLHGRLGHGSGETVK